MKITGLRAVLLSNDYGPGSSLEWVGGRIETWDAALIEVETDVGVSGVGEVAQAIMGADAVPGTVEALRRYTVGLCIDDPGTVGDELRAKTAFWTRGGISSGVIGAIEAAAWDAAGKYAGKPAFELMGGRPRELGIYASGGLGVTYPEVVAWIETQVERGFQAVKFRAMKDTDTTIGLLDHVSQHVSPEVKLILDLVQGCASRPWPLSDVLAVAARLKDLNVLWLEEPCHADDYEGYARVRREVDVPISGVESMSTRSEFRRLLDMDGVDIAQPDASMLGGPRQLHRVVADATARGIAVVPHIWGTGVTVMTNMHAALATDIQLIEMCTIENPLREAVLIDPIVVLPGGRVPCPTAPGLGVSLTLDIEKEFRYRPGRGHIIK